MICLQFGHHSDLDLCQISSQTVQKVLYFFQPRPVDAFPEQQLPIGKVVALQVQFLQSPLMVVHLSTDLANQLRLQSSESLPFAPVFVDRFFQEKCIDPLHVPHELRSHHHHHGYHHQSYHCHQLQTNEERHHQLHSVVSEVWNNHLQHHCTH